MNTASRMESTCEPGRIQISASTFEMLDQNQQSQFKATGGVEVKGKGQMETYVWIDVCVQHSFAHSLDLLDFPPLDRVDLNTFLARSCNNAASAANSLSPGEVQDILASKRSVLYGLGQNPSPLVAMTRSCQEAVQLLHSIAEARNYRRASTVVQQLDMQGSLLLKLTKAAALARRSPTSCEELVAPCGLRHWKSDSSLALSSQQSLSEQLQSL